jgi:hypothetical protein
MTMARTIYTERDIEDMAKRGVTEIEVNDSVYITDVAREMMDRLGIRRKVSGGAAPLNLSSPSGANSRSGASSSTGSTLTEAEREQVIDKVKSGVIARLGAGVDSAVVDKIVRKIVAQL